ncbi:bifunctional 3-phenylpropionate/cinnamic acid dioxygenase ferredoxin subunit [uncultured Psychrobacter sp.]|uniref:bifunctional 3-phenylpropionate/cinnamic acid dioxygenase ferredoxin subunit n=1 Tax=uncultured Psychrobacter sp. TaxID=259303 RepID=UPI003459B31E
MFHVGKLDDLEIGEAIKLDQFAAPIAVIRGESGEVYAIDDTCTHAQASFCDGFVEGDTVECPLHMSVFCLKTGVPENPPAMEAVNTYAVEIKDGEIYIEVPQ